MRISDWSSDVCSSDLKPATMIADMMTAMIQKKWASDVLTPLSGEASSPRVAIPVIPPFRRRRLTLLRRDRKVKRWGEARGVSRSDGGRGGQERGSSGGFRWVAYY